MYSQVQWVEEDHQVLSFIVLQGNLLELSFHHGGALEKWCRALQKRSHFN